MNLTTTGHQDPMKLPHVHVIGKQSCGISQSVIGKRVDRRYRVCSSAPIILISQKKTHHSNTGTPGGVQPFVRLKGPNEYVSDYQAYVMVGGGNMWMTLESGVATSWVRSVRAL